MSWRIATEHRSAYHYGEQVSTSFNEARITPAFNRGQRVIESSIMTLPKAPLFSYVDYWSTRVMAFDVSEPHSELIITGRSVVETPSSIPRHGGMEWEDLDDDKIRDRFAEFLLATSYTAGDEELTDMANLIRARQGGPLEALDACVEWVNTNMEYVTGSTGVFTSALQAWRQKTGVCQDFAHLTVAVLRLMGIPARYISGYLHPDPEAAIGTETPGQSHAWVEAWLGSWIPADPTNGALVGDRHVTVARGRDYADVAPLRGVYHGGAVDRLDVSVTLTRLA